MAHTQYIFHFVVGNDDDELEGRTPWTERRDVLQLLREAAASALHDDNLVVSHHVQWKALVAGLVGEIDAAPREALEGRFPGV